MLFDHPAVAEIAQTQAGVATTSQILAAGVTEDMLRRARERGEVTEHQCGVLASAWSPPNLEMHEFAAVLGAGPGAALASLSALHRYGARKPPERIHVCVAHGRRPRLRNVVLHRSRTWRPGDLWTIDGIRVTNPVRTGYDAAEILRPMSLRGVIEKMIVDGHVTAAELIDAFPQMRGRHGLKRIRPILNSLHDDLPGFDSKLEADFLHIVEELALPSPEHHVVLETRQRSYEVDFLWRRPRLVVEVDGPHHLVPEQRRFDNHRDSELQIAGWPIQRFLDTEIRNDAGHVKDVLRARLQVRT